jgi:hypothetical protein
VTLNEPPVGDSRTTVVLLPTVSSIEKDPVQGLSVLIESFLMVIWKRFHD